MTRVLKRVQARVLLSESVVQRGGRVEAGSGWKTADPRNVIRMSEQRTAPSNGVGVQMPWRTFNSPGC